MRTRLAKQCVGRGHAPSDRAQKLDFLAAHHVWATLALAQAGDDSCPAGLDPVDGARQIARLGGAFNIRSLGPATVRPGHAANQYRKLAPLPAERGDLSGIVAIVHAQDAAIVVQRIDYLTALDQEGAAVGGPPVDGDEWLWSSRCFASHVSLSVANRDRRVPCWVASLTRRTCSRVLKLRSVVDLVAVPHAAEDPLAVFEMTFLNPQHHRRFPRFADG